MAGQAIQPAKESAGLKWVSPDDLFARVNETFNAIARRAFEIFEGTGWTFGHDLEDWFKAEAELLHPVHLNLAESEEALIVEAEVPGFSAKELEISVEPRRLTIAGKRETKEERKDKKSIYTERCANQIMRIVDLPVEVDTGNVEATLKDGILELTLPKATQAKKVKVEAKG